jgi:hypothetical protein
MSDIPAVQPAYVYETGGWAHVNAVPARSPVQPAEAEAEPPQSPPSVYAGSASQADRAALQHPALAAYILLSMKDDRGPLVIDDVNGGLPASKVPAYSYNAIKDNYDSNVPGVSFLKGGRRWRAQWGSTNPRPGRSTHADTNSPASMAAGHQQMADVIRARVREGDPLVTANMRRFFAQEAREAARDAVAEQEQEMPVA